MEIARIKGIHIHIVEIKKKVVKKWIFNYIRCQTNNLKKKHHFNLFCKKFNLFSFSVFISVLYSDQQKTLTGI